MFFWRNFALIEWRRQVGCGCEIQMSEKRGELQRIYEGGPRGGISDSERGGVGLHIIQWLIFWMAQPFNVLGISLLHEVGTLLFSASFLTLIRRSSEMPRS